MTAMYTALVLVRNLDSRDHELRFRQFRIWSIPQGDRQKLKQAERLFPRASVNFGDWIWEREYQEVPKSLVAAPSGLGRIPEDVEDTLLLLRLFKAGELSFVSVAVEGPDNEVSGQYPYRAISEMVNVASFTFEFNQDNCVPWDLFAAELAVSSGWKSSWFQIARRFFLYGGGKEFNPNFDEIDRIVDYMIALEAALVPERDFVGRRLRERAVRLLHVRDEEEARLMALLRDFYDVRSAIAHGSGITEPQKQLVGQRWKDFESATREILAGALRQLPTGEQERKQTLSQIYDIPEDIRVDKLLEDFQAIKSNEQKKRALDQFSRVK